MSAKKEEKPKKQKEQIKEEKAPEPEVTWPHHHRGEYPATKGELDEAMERVARKPKPAPTPKPKI